MINYRVADLHGLLQALRSEGCSVLEKTDDSEYGKFGWVIDPEGNKVELGSRRRDNESRVPPRARRGPAAPRRMGRRTAAARRASRMNGPGTSP